MEGIITDIQRFSIHDGPGIRSTVFFKGCNMKCAWCHNPETIEAGPQLEFFPDKCIGCGECVKVCRNGALPDGTGQRKCLRELCKACGKCAKVCYAEALVLVGKKTTPEEVLSEIVQDTAYYNSSGGGVTLSGGECLLQRDFAYGLLELCKRNNINTAIETNMTMQWDRIESILTVTDLVMMDLKIFNDKLHTQWTGISNKRILENIGLMAKTCKPLIIRTPIIPGVNDDEREISDIAEFISTFPTLQYYELLPYNPLGSDKYDRLGMTYATAGLRHPPKEKMHSLAKAAREKGIKVVMENDNS